MISLSFFFKNSLAQTTSPQHFSITLTLMLSLYIDELYCNVTLGKVHLEENSFGIGSSDAPVLNYLNEQ